MAIERLDQLRKGSLGAWWKCTAAGSPGTWVQILPAFLDADPDSATFPTGDLLVNVTQGTLKRHAGGLSWETVVGAARGKVGFWGATPVVQPSGADQAAVTLRNTDGEIGGLTISDPPTQAEVQALRFGSLGTTYEQGVAEIQPECSTNREVPFLKGSLLTGKDLRRILGGNPRNVINEPAVR